MEIDNNSLSDYNILGLDDNASFSEVKSNYYKLSRFYHPDSNYNLPGIINLTKEEKNIAFIKINKAFNNLKKKLNFDEVDLPKYKIYYDEYSVKKNDELLKLDFLKNSDNSDNSNNFNKIFNKIFEQEHKKQSIDEPYSIYYEKPKEDERNISDKLIQIKEHVKTDNKYEFGINYIEDHSSDKWHDYEILENFKNLEISNLENNNLNSETLDTLLDKKINERSLEINFDKNDLELIKQESEIKDKIFNFKQNVEKIRKTRLFLN